MSAGRSWTICGEVTSVLHANPAFRDTAVALLRHPDVLVMQRGMVSARSAMAEKEDDDCAQMANKQTIYDILLPMIDD